MTRVSHDPWFPTDLPPPDRNSRHAVFLDVLGGRSVTTEVEVFLDGTSGMPVSVGNKPTGDLNRPGFLGG